MLSVGTAVGVVAQTFGIPDIGGRSPDVSNYTDQQLKDIAFYKDVPNCEYQTSIMFISPRILSPGTVTTAMVRNREGTIEYSLCLGEIGNEPMVEQFESERELTDSLVKRWRDIALTEGNVRVSTQATILLEPNDTTTILNALDTTIVDRLVTWKYWKIQAAIKIYGNISRKGVKQDPYIVLELSEVDGDDTLTAIVTPDMQYLVGTLACEFNDDDPSSQKFSMRTQGVITDRSAIDALHELVQHYIAP